MKLRELTNCVRGHCQLSTTPVVVACVVATAVLLTVSALVARAAPPAVGSVTSGAANSSGPMLYDNTNACTVTTQNIAVGGSLSFIPALSVKDWFTLGGGGLVTGWELLLTNCGPEAVENTIADMTFFSGTDSENQGTTICDAENCAFFTTTVAPALPKIPVRCDAETGEPHVIRVSVDYVSNEYTIEDVNDGVVLEHVSNIGSPPFGRSPFRLPAGKIGVLLRLGSERSICAGGNPVCGPLLASGGSGNEDGMYIVGTIAQCSPFFPLLCDDPGWTPDFACTGGDACYLDRPFYGMALTLFMGPSEDEDGNNDIATADALSVDPPSPCSGGLATVTGFVGDHTQTVSCAPDGFFDGDGDGDIDLLDWGGFQACFGSPVSKECCVYDQNQDGAIDLDDFKWFIHCEDNPGHMSCSGLVFDPATLLSDVDIYRVAGVAADQVVSIFVEGSRSSTDEPLWDPYLRIFWDEGNGLEERGVSDDYERQSLDAFTTVAIPSAGIVNDTMYIGVSSAANADYDPAVPSSVMEINAEDAGSYTLSVAITDPTCVQDDDSGAADECYTSKHEPDDTLADADARGDLIDFLVNGAIGDGAFAEMGQDIDIYRLNLGGPLADAKSITARVAGPSGIGFATVFDLAMALYDSNGDLIATGDQASTAVVSGHDQSRPQLAANVDGANIGGDGIYYLAVFGSDRGLFDSSCNPSGIFPAVPPTLLSFPHGVGVAGTQDSDLRPLVGGRVNKPGSQLEGCTDDPKQNPPETMQCYQLVILPSPDRLATTGPDDVDELSSTNGNDSIAHAATKIDGSDRLATTEVLLRHLGNGPFGGWQGDVDFYEVHAEPGQIVAVNIADTEQPPVDDHPVRSYLALYDATGRPFAYLDYSLERLNQSMFDEISDEIAATLVAVVPDQTSGTIYAAIGIDNGHLMARENLPFDPMQPGTTLSRRFETKTWRARQYGIGVAVLDPVANLDDSVRMFIVPLRGADDRHVGCFIGSDNDGDPQCYPPILEVDPNTGKTIKILNGSSPVFFFNTFRTDPNIPTDQRLSANPLIAYDGSVLYVCVEECGGVNCSEVTNSLFFVDPDLLPGDVEFIKDLGMIEGGFEAVYSGMVEIDGTHLFILDTGHNTLEYWDKTVAPTAGAISTTIDLTDLIAGTPDCSKAEFDDIDGDLGTDGSRIYVACTCEGDSQGICVFDPDPETGLVAFEGIIDDPTTNEELIPGPRLGGLDLLGTDILITSDRNGPVVQHWNMTTNGVTAFELPPDYVIDRLTVR